MQVAPRTDNVFPQTAADRGGSITIPDKPISCVPYAREHSDVNIHGDANTWWDKAAGHFQRSAAPSDGAVMVLTGYAGPGHAHLAVVREVVSSREIRVDHANWLNNGAIYLNDPVADISPAQRLEPGSGLESRDPWLGHATSTTCRDSSGRDPTRAATAWQAAIRTNE